MTGRSGLLLLVSRSGVDLGGGLHIGESSEEIFLLESEILELLLNRKLLRHELIRLVLRRSERESGRGREWHDGIDEGHVLRLLHLVHLLHLELLLLLLLEGEELRDGSLGKGESAGRLLVSESIAVRSSRHTGHEIERGGGGGDEAFVAQIVNDAQRRIEAHGVGVERRSRERETKARRAGGIGGSVLVARSRASGGSGDGRIGRGSGGEFGDE